MRNRPSMRIIGALLTLGACPALGTGAGQMATSDGANSGAPGTIDPLRAGPPGAALRRLSLGEYRNTVPSGSSFGLNAVDRAV